MERPCWSRFLAEIVACEGPMLDQSILEGLYPMYRTHSGAVHQELQPMGRTDVGGVCRGLYLMGGNLFHSM